MVSECSAVSVSNAVVLDPRDSISLVFSVILASWSANSVSLAEILTS